MQSIGACAGHFVCELPGSSKSCSMAWVMLFSRRILPMEIKFAKAAYQGEKE